MNILNSENKRTELVKKNAVYGILVKGVSIIVSLMLVPMTIDYVSSEMYGIWLTLSTVIQWISFFDVGFGLGLRNQLGIALANNNTDLGRALVSSTYVVLSAIFLPIGIIFYIISPMIDWSSFLNVDSVLNPTLISCSRIVIICLCLTLVLKVLQNVLQAYQHNVYASAIDTFGNIVSLLAIWILTKTTFPNLVYLAYVFSGIPVLIYIIFSIQLYRTRFKDVAPKYSVAKFTCIKPIFNLGSQFFVIQIACLLLFQTTNILISRMCGSNDVTIYNVTYKYINVVVMVLNIITAPLWSAYTDAYAREDFGWINRIYRKVGYLYILALISIFVLVCISPWVYDLWLGDSVKISINITIFVAIYMATYSWSSIQSVLLNGIGKIRLQLYVSIFQTIIFLAFAFILGEKFQLIGMLIAMIIAMILPASILTVQVNKLLKGNSIGIWNK